MKFNIVGAGPVGLWVATQLKKRAPDSEVVVYERHKLGDYVRSHALHVEWASPRLYAKKNHTKEEAVILAAITGTVSTNLIEAELLKHAKNLGVVIKPEMDLDLNSAEYFGGAGTFIAADGAKSKIRQALLGEDGIEKQDLQHVVEVKVWAKNPAQQHFRGTVGDHGIFKFMMSETVGRFHSGAGTPLTARFFVDRATYDAVPEATFKNPTNYPALPRGVSGGNRLLDLKADIRRYLETVSSEEKVEHGTELITKLTLSIYAAKKFAVRNGDKIWFLTGDAAMGLPYFRSLNAGLLIGSQLAGILTNPVLDDEGKIMAYNAVRIPDKMTEYAIAGVKNLALNAYDAIRKLL